ncbi:patatin-like phospholipase family protein [Pedobacter helvus]|uniref:Patatin-like phospholipase family protein n=1 Tax=Pedobacter helvus TaxID=2563444 RepID=A0ABW9JKT8_9SPHI|nr:patatin-like phospholipase family protein [Pedobacter ureilyticus]
MKIALAFSGGGYRAASFSLGTLSMLNELSLGDVRLLDTVEILSTVSGGTITGTRYALSLERAESFGDFYHSLYGFLSNAKLVEMALAHLADDSRWQNGRVRSLVSAFADVYDSELFDGALFGSLMEDVNPKRIKHVSFNATEFANGLQFRFQWSEKMVAPRPGEFARGVIGNNYFNLPEQVASHIRMADIMAASSCFPGGFEPINFPSDFVLPKGAVEHLSKKVAYPVGLMDGGIVDNQGIHPIMLATERILQNEIVAGRASEEDNPIDLVIVSDVASPYMEDFRASSEDRKGWWKGLTPRLIVNLNYGLLLLAGIGLICSICAGTSYGLFFSTVLMTLSVVLFFIFHLIEKLVAGLGISEQFLEPLDTLKKFKLYVFQSLVKNRLNSFMILTTDVFLKHVRRLNYNTLYRDKRFINRRIMTAVYELTSDQQTLDRKVARGSLPSYLMPTELVRKNSDKAAAMGTTLWFTPKELREGMLDSLIACGQYNACWNLLEYIEKLKKNKENTSAEHKLFSELEDVLRVYWENFQRDPLYLVKKYRSV